MAAAMSEVVTTDTSGIFPLDLKVGFKVYTMSMRNELVSGRASIQNITEVIATNGFAVGPHSQRSATE